MFSEIDIDRIVSCCGTLFSSSSETTLSLLFEVPNSVVLAFFYTNYLLLVGGFYLRKESVFKALNMVFMPVSIVSLILFFGTYIYELPTHHCPFCYLQKDYHYIGYGIYLTLFLGTFYGIIGKKKISLLFNTAFTLIVTTYPILYYFNNGVWL